MPRYTVDLEVHHQIEIEADSIQEAEELAYEEFISTRIAYDELDIYAVEVATG